MSRVEVDESAAGEALAAWLQFADERLGPDIADDARRYCPVKTGALKASIEHHMEDEDLIVSATGGGEDEDGNLFVSRRPGRLSVRAEPQVRADAPRHMGTLATRPVHHVAEGGEAYAAYVELGHRVYHPSTGETGPDEAAPRPFLRPALYQPRGD